MERMILVGAEQVATAAHEILRAAAAMESAASRIESALYQHDQRMAEFLVSLGALIDAAKKGA